MVWDVGGDCGVCEGGKVNGGMIVGVRGGERVDGDGVGEFVCGGSVGDWCDEKGVGEVRV